MFKKIAIAATLALISASALAQSPSRFYAGADVVSTTARDIEGSESGFGGFAGFRINETFAVDGTLRRLAKDGNIKFNQAAVSMVATGHAAGEWEKFSVFARAGVNRVNARGCNVVTTATEVTTTCGEGSLTRGLIGIGMGYDFTERITARLEVQKPHSDFTTTSLNVGFNF
jgi:hypothetical protein